MALKLVPPSAAPSSRTKTCALAAFRLIRSVQAKAAQAPGILVQVRNDIVAAWRESGDARPNA